MMVHSMMEESSISEVKRINSNSMVFFFRMIKTHPGEEGFDSNNISVWGTKVFDSPIFNFTLLISNGGAYIAAEGDRLLVDSEESKEVLKELQDLIYVHQVAPKPAVTSAMPSSQQMLMDGQLGMYMAGQFEIATFAEAEWGDFGVAPLPKFKKPARGILFYLGKWLSARFPERIFRNRKFGEDQNRANIHTGSKKKTGSRESSRNWDDGRYL